MAYASSVCMDWTNTSQVYAGMERNAMTDEECPMCAEYDIPDDYVVLKKVDLARDYVPVSKIEALPYDDWCFCRTCLGVKDLLKEKEKPEQ